MGTPSVARVAPSASGSGVALPPAAVMRRNGRSFWFASRFLPRQVAAHAAELYAFCRTLDDLADQNPTPETVHRLETLAHELPLGKTQDSCAAGLLALAERYPLPLDVAAHLVSAFVEDGSKSLRLQTETDLVRYCFGVAGTVGLMMSPLLEVQDRHACLYAADLGIAMQMTNIARDVLEDACNGRRYLPGDWLDDLTPQQILADPCWRPDVGAAIEHLLNLADRYYLAAAKGFVFIPYRSRVAIRLASAVYREIGVTLRASGVAWWGPRTVVSTSRRFGLAAQVLAGVSASHGLPDEAELARLHRPFAEMPGTA